MKRRNFLQLGSLSAIASFSMPLNGLFAKDSPILKNKGIKPIAGSWFEFQHLLPNEGKYWDPALASFSEAQWKAKIKEIASVGFEYLVLQEVALDGKTFYLSKFAPKFQLGCNDPLEAVLSAADEVGIRFFIGNDFWDDCHKGEYLIKDAGIRKIREQTMREIAEKYAHHKSFYGWYFPNEAYLMPYFNEDFISYVNACSYYARQLMPSCVNLIAPYNVRKAVYDDKFVKQLDRLNIDIIAYQDGVGVNHTKLGDAGKYYELLYKAHLKSARSRLWADVELFYFEDGTGGNLLTAPFSRIIKQMEDVSPFVDKILVYQYLGQMNAPETVAYAGHINKKSVELYERYKKWYDQQDKL